MRTLKSGCIIAAISMVTFVSCSKDDDSPGTTELLQHNWGLDSITLRNHTATTDNTLVYYGLAQDYFDFRTDNKLYSQTNGTKDTSTYTLLNSNTLVLIHKDGSRDTGIITTLTNNKLVGKTKKILNATDYTETTSYLKR